MITTKEVKISGEFLEDGQIQVKTRTVILEDGVEVGSKNHRHVVDVGDNVDNEDPIIRGMAATLHTPATIAARVNFIAKEKSKAALRQQ